LLEAEGAPRDDASVVLCRCGHSSNKPYCDGTHRHVGFVDSGVVSLDGESACSPAAGRLTIIPIPDGPLKCMGGVALSSADGRIREIQDIRLCRCGGSATKPFCDGTHRRNGFVSER
jgi:CDGSH-type Zn-finger protein